MKLDKEFYNIKFVLTLFKIKIIFHKKNLILDDLKSFLVYKFTGASCSSSYIGKNLRHFKTKIEEQIKNNNNSHIFKDLHSTATYLVSYISLSCKIIDKPNSKFDLKSKESFHINWRKPNHLLSHFPLSSIIFIISTLIIGIFYCLKYTSLFLHLIKTHLVNIFYDNYVINICPRQLLRFL